MIMGFKDFEDTQKRRLGEVKYLLSCRRESGRFVGLKVLLVGDPLHDHADVLQMVVRTQAPLAPVIVLGH